MRRIDLRGIASREMRQNHFLDNIQYLGCEEEHTLPILDCCTEVYYGFYYRNKRGIATQIDCPLTSKATQLRHFQLCN